MKTEPDTFSIQDLQRLKKSSWDGVRNYQARNFMRDQMKIGDMVLIYHSSCDDVGVAGIGKVCKESHADLSALDKKSPYFDPKATNDEPRWYMVEIAWVETFARIIPLSELKVNPKLKEMLVIKKGNRLSITPVSKNEFLEIKKMSTK